MGIFPHPQPLSKMERGENLPYRKHLTMNADGIGYNHRGSVHVKDK
jgi:hypothetical protein